MRDRFPTLGWTTGRASERRGARGFQRSASECAEKRGSQRQQQIRRQRGPPVAGAEPAAEPVDQDTLDVDHTTSLDAADTGETVDQDSIDTGTTESLDAAEVAPDASPSIPAALPEIANDSLRAEAQATRETLVVAERRYAAANAEYSEMRADDFPRGEAAAAIVKEHAAARRAYEQASARYTEILQQVDPGAAED